MKDYIVTVGGSRGRKNEEFDNKEDAIKRADKLQKSRAFEVVVLQKIGTKNGKEEYETCYSAKFNCECKARYLF